MKVKALDQVGEKWQRRASAAGGDYEAGVMNPRVPWKTGVTAAVGNYATAMAEALARKAFDKGVARTSEEDWRRAAVDKGAPNYPRGITFGLEKYTKRWAPSRAALEGLTLAPRGPRNSAGNYERSRKVGEVLAKVRLAG